MSFSRSGRRTRFCQRLRPGRVMIGCGREHMRSSIRKPPKIQTRRRRRRRGEKLPLLHDRVIGQGLLPPCQPSLRTAQATLARVTSERGSTLHGQPLQSERRVRQTQPTAGQHLRRRHRRQSTPRSRSESQANQRRLGARQRVRARRRHQSRSLRQGRGHIHLFPWARYGEVEFMQKCGRSSKRGKKDRRRKCRRTARQMKSQ